MVHLNSVFPQATRPAASLLLLGAALLTQAAHAQTAFQSGTLTVVRYGDRAGTAVPTGTLPASLDEYTTAGTLVRSIDIPIADAGTNFGFVGSAVRSNNDGITGISPDRSKLSIAGFNLATGNGNPNGSAAARVVAIVTANGAVATTTGITGYNNPLRCSTVTNAGGIYVGYGAESTGIAYTPTSAAVNPPAAVASPTVITPTVSLKKFQIYDGNLYFATSSTGALTAGGKIRRYTGLPTAAATPTDLPGIPATSTSTAGVFLMFDVNTAVAGVDLLYYFDDASTGSVLNKYTYNGTTWTARGTYTVANLQGDPLIRDVTGRLENGVPVLYGVSYSSLVKMADTGGYTNNINVTQTALVDNATVGGNTLPYAFRGISFSPGTREQISLATAPAAVARQILVYPNPAQGSAQLSLPTELQNEKLTAAIVNVLGQTVRQQTLAAGAERTLALDGLSAGIYTLRLETSQGSVSKRLILE